MESKKLSPKKRGDKAMMLRLPGELARLVDADAKSSLRSQQNVIRFVLARHYGLVNQDQKVA